MHANIGPRVAHTTLASQCRELMPTRDLPSAVHEGCHAASSLLQHEMPLDVADVSKAALTAPSVLVRSTSRSDRIADIPARQLCAMCGRLRVGKDFLRVAGLVGAAMCSACRCGSHDRWP